MSTRYSVAGVPYQTDWKVDRAVREGFQANPWVFRAVEVICYSALSRKVVLRQGDPDTGKLVPIEQDDSRLLFRFNRRANPWETSKILRYRLIAQFLLSSRGVFIEVTRSRAGSIAMITLLDPDLVDVIPSPTNPISAFQVRTTGDTGGKFDPLPPFDPEDNDQTNSVLWIRSPHPTILTEGMSPVQAAGLSIDLDRYARLYNRDYMQGGGRPGGILSIKGTVEDETVKVLESRFNTNARPGEVTAISADAMDYHDLSTAPRDMQWGDSMNWTRKEVSIIFGVPESMMGDASGRTFDNADAEYAVFMEHRFAPLIALVDDQLDVLTGGYADDHWLRHDLSDVWVLARHRRAEEDRAVDDYNNGLLTADDVRKVKGWEPLDVPASRVLLLPGGRVPVGDGKEGHENDAEEVAALAMMGSPQAADAGAEAAAGAAQGAGVASFNAQTNAAASRLRVVGGQGDSVGFEQRDALGGDTLTLEGGGPPAELEGKQSRARSGELVPAGPPAPVWR